MSIYIGAYYPDRQLDESLFARALVKVAAGLAGYRKHPIQSAPPFVDIQFLMPGKEESPNFEGMRLHSYDTTSSTLRIESAVPHRIINSPHTEDYILAVMQDAVDNAADFFASQQLSFIRDDYMALIDMLLPEAYEESAVVRLN